MASALLQTINCTDEEGSECPKINMEDEGKMGLKIQERMSAILSQLLLCFIVSLVCLPTDMASAAAMKNPPTKVDAIVIGDRVVDIGLSLGVVPTAISVRGSFWPKSNELKLVSKMLGCPGCVTKKSKGRVPKAIKQYGVKRIIVEKSDHYCLYKPEVKPENIAPILEGMDVTVEYVDFTKGVDNAILQVGKLFGKEQEAEKLVQDYGKQLAKLEEMKKQPALNRKVVILNGIMQEGTGKSFIRVEAPGGYSDKYLLGPLGCENVGGMLAGERKVDKGHVTVRSLAKLKDIQPDVIVITGDSAPVQKRLNKEAKKSAEFASIPALKAQAVYSLPRYVDSGVLEYPEVYRLWAKTLEEK